MKHFPAPWRIEGEFDDDVTVEIRSADDRLVCEIGPYTGEWTDEEIANARLIPAAPELLEALKAILPWHDAHPLEVSSNPIINACRDAIAKAEGRS